MVSDLEIATITAQVNSMRILRDAPIPQDIQEVIITNLSNLIAMTLNMAKDALELNDDQVMSLLTLAIMKAVEITKDE